ncbi:nadp-binding [Trichoderma arundinaceum]|uniref:Nadp-binding n=1 Tax=Trichoderma arundinaceum TaxID=490622 RepID=A0A395NZ29_TRIAR|nr:nadp-binding [Trichoderma arundinaceum]
MTSIKRIVVLGGTGAQGSNVVKHLSQAGIFDITVPTRDTSSLKARDIEALPNVKLLQADYLTEAGMRSVLIDQDGVYFNIDSFAVTEPFEYFWTFRAYEIAVQSGLKLFILPGGPNRYEAHRYKEEFRNVHGAVSGRLSDWLSHQPTDILPWSISYGGVYAEMLWSLLQPRIRDDGVYEFAAPIGDGNIPLTPLDDYGARVRWMFENPEAVIGKTVVWAPFYTSYKDLVKIFEETTGKRAIFKDLTQDEWFDRLKAHRAPDSKFPHSGPVDDDTTFTFRQTFGAWWNFWKFNDQIRDPKQEKDAEIFSNEVYPTRHRSLKEWMVANNYTGKR